MSANLHIRDLANNHTSIVPLSAAAFAVACSETWREDYLRRGQSDITPAGLDFRVLPCPTERGQSGFIVAAGRHGTTTRTRRPFSSLALRLHALAALGATATPGAGRVTAIEVQVDEAGLDLAPVFAAESAAARFPFHPLSYPLNRLLAAARPTGPVESPAPMPVLFCAAARARADQFARAGALLVPPIETGSLLLGVLGRCPETGEFYVVITEALRIRGADAGTYHLAFTAESWRQLDGLLRRRAESGLRLVGTSHGHNFLPSQDDQGHCASCALRPTCTLQTAHASDDDQRWMGAVFNHRHPWQIAHITGLDARGGGTEVLCTLRDGRMQARPYHVLDRLPDDFPWKGATHET